MNNHTHNPVEHFWITTKLSTDFFGFQSYSYFDHVSCALLPTWFKSNQVIEKLKIDTYIKNLIKDRLKALRKTTHKNINVMIW